MRAFLIDLDGVLYVGKKPIEGVKEALKTLDESGIPYRFVSNSTRRCRDSVALRLSGLGYDIDAKKIFTPPLAAIRRMKEESWNRCYLLTTGDVHKDFDEAGIAVSNADVDAVVVGDAGAQFTYDKLNVALRLILDGAKLLAMEKDRFWMEPEGLVLSTGPFVAALEYASGQSSELLGKPSGMFFKMALDDMGIPASDAAMIGDDISSDVGGSKALGMKGILVKTGKYREDVVKTSDVRPDLVLNSLADIVDYIK